MRHKPRNQSKHQANPKAVPARVRIIGGQWRGRKLPVADIEGLRPTGDRIRETLFNWLAPDIHGARCLDLYSGSGALGFEALSRGAVSTCFVELNPAVCRQIEANIQLLAVNNAQLVSDNALRWLASQPGSLDFDLIFIDPPFALDLWDKTIRALSDNEERLKPGTLVYIESPKNQLYHIPANWQCRRDKQTGQVDYRLFQVAPGNLDGEPSA